MILNSFKIDTIGVAIPSTYGTLQRESLKVCLLDAFDRIDVQLVTRPLAAAVILHNQSVALNSSVNVKASSLNLNSSEKYQVVFDMTESELKNRFKIFIIKINRLRNS